MRFLTNMAERESRAKELLLYKRIAVWMAIIGGSILLLMQSVATAAVIWLTFYEAVEITVIVRSVLFWACMLLLVIAGFKYKKRLVK